jgi:hypothetical protein
VRREEKEKGIQERKKRKRGGEGQSARHINKQTAPFGLFVLRRSIAGAEPDATPEAAPADPPVYRALLDEVGGQGSCLPASCYAINTVRKRAAAAAARPKRPFPGVVWAANSGLRRPRTAFYKAVPNTVFVRRERCISADNIRPI